MQLILIDQNPAIVAAWRSCFAPHPEVGILGGDILAIAGCAVVSPANGYGFMDGGLDRRYTEFFGLTPQTALQQAIARRPEGYLPVGAAILVRTGHPRIPYMIAAPTMLGPEPGIPAANCGRALYAVLRTVDRHAALISTVYCPGLGTGIGQVDPEEAAREMAGAYGKWKVLRNVQPSSLK